MTERASPKGPRAFLRYALIAVGAGYLGFAFVPQGLEYLELKLYMLNARAALQHARWEDADLRCDRELPVGPHLRQLFQNPEVYVLRLRWGWFRPRYEFFVVGKANVRPGMPLRHLQLSVEMDLHGRALLTDAVYVGEPDQLDNARLLLKLACDRPKDR